MKTWVRAVQFLAVVAFLWGASPSRAAEKVVFIVNVDNPISRLNESEIRDYFLKRRTQWPDGKPVRFIDWDDGTQIRATFLNKVVKKSARELELYWIGEKLYRGNSAPIKVGSSSLVVSFVAKLPGAIGYLSADTPLESTRVKKIEVPAGRE